MNKNTRQFVKNDEIIDLFKIYWKNFLKIHPFILRLQKNSMVCEKKSLNHLNRNNNFKGSMIHNNNIMDNENAKIDKKWEK